MTIRRTRSAALGALLATSALTFSSVAMAATPAPKFIAPDDNGVDLTTGLPYVTVKEGGIGSGPGRLEMDRIWAEGAGWSDNWSGGLYSATVGGVTKTYVEINGISETFSQANGVYTNDKADGATLAPVVNGGGNMLFTASDGTQINFYPPDFTVVYSCPGASAGSCQVPTKITRPDGLQFRLSWKGYYECTSGLPGEPCADGQQYQRLQGVTSSAGYSFTISYGANSTAGPQYSPPPDAWFQRTGVTFDNNVTAPSPAVTIAYDTATANTVKVTDAAQRTSVFTTDSSGRLTGITRPGSSSANIAYAYGSDGTVSSVTMDGVTTGYSRSGSTETVTDPVAGATHPVKVDADPASGRPAKYTDQMGHITTYTYWPSGQLKRTTYPEGNYTELAYDARGNVTSTTQGGKANSTPATIVSSASYDTTCTNIVKCNKPNSTTDARGNATRSTAV